jgi:2-polyprenyl-3-methyl-5-hydroxy-6-metoxy-1,4-benzoquinol methylase
MSATAFTWKDTELYRQFYRDNPNLGGRYGRRHTALVRAIIRHAKATHVFDFGCGCHHSLVTALQQDTRLSITGYDPAIADEAQTETLRNTIDLALKPDLLVSTDVLEHVPEAELSQCWDIFRTLAPRWLYIVVSTRNTRLRLSDGTSLHKTVRPALWWKTQLSTNLPGYTVRFINQFQASLTHEAQFVLQVKPAT